MSDEEATVDPGEAEPAEGTITPDELVNPGEPTQEHDTAREAVQEAVEDRDHRSGDDDDSLRGEDEASDA